MLPLVVVTVVVSCSMNFNMTLVQTIENHLFGLNHSRDVLVPKFYFRCKIGYLFRHIYMDKTVIVSDV